MVIIWPNTFRFISHRYREIQVTLDGPEEIHNKRRPLKGGQGTFDRIVAGIDAALECETAGKSPGGAGSGKYQCICPGWRNLP